MALCAHPPPTPLNRQAQASCLMPPITRANCQSENFTITNHNRHYTKRQLISHQHQHQHQHKHMPTLTDKIKPNSKGKKKAKLKVKDMASQSQAHSSKERELDS